MSSPLDHPGWAGVGAWCQAGQPDKWPLSTVRMFHSARPATLPCPRSKLRDYSGNVTISLQFKDFNLHKSWDFRDRLISHKWNLLYMGHKMVLMMRADISPGAPRDNGQRAGPRPGDHRDVSRDQGPSCDVSRESVISSHHLSRAHLHV